MAVGMSIKLFISKVVRVGRDKVYLSFGFTHKLHLDNQSGSWEIVGSPLSPFDQCHTTAGVKIFLIAEVVKL